MGQLNLNAADGNYISWNTSGIAPSSFISRSVGTKIFIYPEVSDTSVDYAIGLENGYMWFSAPSAPLAGRGYRWYSGTSRIMEVSSNVGGSGGRMRVISTSDLGESSIGFYSYTDMRAVSACDVWVCGANGWTDTGYSIEQMEYLVV